jgi:hypothetical protein
MTGTRTLATALVAGLALLAAACGGNDESQVSASTQWANDLCTAVSTWRSDISSTADTLTSNPSRAGFEQAADDAKKTTKTLADTVKGLGAPDTQAGEQARTTIDTLSTELSTDVETIQKAVEDASGVQGLLTAVTTVSATVAKMSDQLSSSVDDLASLRDVDDQLKQSFADAKSCDGLLPSGS